MVTQPLGQATYQLDLDASKWSAGRREVEQTRQQIITSMRSVDDATAKVGRTQTAVATTGRGLDMQLGGLARTSFAVALGMGGLNLAVTALHAGLRNTLMAAADDAASITRLQTAVDASGHSWSDYESRLDDVIKRGQQLAFSDDQTRSGLAILVAQTNSVEEAMRRYAIAQDLARGANIDVVTASRLLGKITEDNVTALQRYGVAVRKGSTETEALAQIQAKFSGQAAKFATTDAAQFERTADHLRESGEALGRILLPPVVALSAGVEVAATNTEFLLGKVEALASNEDVFGALTAGAIAFGGALVAIKVTQFFAGMVEGIQAEIAATRSLAIARAQLASLGPVAAPSTAALAGGAIRSAVFTPQAGIIAGTAAIVGLDLAVRHYTGNGIIDYLTGQAGAHSRAARAAEVQAGVQADLNRLIKEGLTPGQAQSVQLLAVIRDAEDKQRAFEKARRDYEDALQRGTAQIGGRPAGQPTLSAEQEARALASAVQQTAMIPMPAAPDFSDQITQVRALNLNFTQLSDLMAHLPRGVVDGLADDLKAAARAAGQAAVAQYEWNKAVDAAKAKSSDFTSALSDLKSFATDLNPATEELKLQKLELEQLKEKMGDAFGAQNQAQLDNLTRLLQLLDDQQGIVTQRVSLFGAEVRRQYGDLAPQAIRNVNDALIKLPVEQQIKLLVVLPDLFKIQAAFAAFIAALRAGATVDIALRIGATTAFPAAGVEKDIFAKPFPGESQQSAAARQRVSPQAQDFLDELNGKLHDLDTNSIGPLGAQADKTGGATKDLVTAESALEDGVISLREALALGLTPAQAAAMESTNDLAVAQDRLAQAQFRANVEAEKGMDANARVAASWITIAAVAIEKGESIEKVIADLNAASLDVAQNALQSIAGKPTREGLQLELRKAELERRRLMLERSGATTDTLKNEGKKGARQPTAADRELGRIEEQEKALQREIDLRNNEFRIMTLKAQLANKTLDTDRDIINAMSFLTAVINKLSETAGNAAINLQRFAGVGEQSPSGPQGAGGRTFSTEEMRFINEVARQRGEPTPFPGFDRGIDYVPRTMPAVIHEGEAVLTAQANRERMAAPVGRGLSTPQPSSRVLAEAGAIVASSEARAVSDTGASTPVNGPLATFQFTITATDWNDIERQVMNRLQDAKNRARRGGNFDIGGSAFRS